MLTWLCLLYLCLMTILGALQLDAHVFSPNVWNKARVSPCTLFVPRPADYLLVEAS
jgi:hypothetical protein